jgi:hypothetical protein
MREAAAVFLSVFCWRNPTQHGVPIRGAGLLLLLWQAAAHRPILALRAPLSQTDLRDRKAHAFRAGHMM